MVTKNLPRYDDFTSGPEKRADERYDRQESAENAGTSEGSLSSAFARELRRVLLEGMDDPEGTATATAPQVKGAAYCDPDELSAPDYDADADAAATDAA